MCRPPTRLGSCARQRTTRCSATRREAMRSSTPPSTGSWGCTRTRRSRRHIAGWNPHHKTHWRLSGSGLPSPRPAEWAPPLSICSGPPGFSPTRRSFRPGLPWGCSVQVAWTPAFVTSGESSRSSQKTIWRTSGSVCWRRTLASSMRHGRRPAARIRCQAARKRSPRWGTSRGCRNLSNQPRPSSTPSPIPANGYVARSGLGQIYIALGRLERAAREWTFGRADGDWEMGWAAPDPRWNALRGKVPGI